MTPEIFALIASYLACADMAAERQLSPGEVQYCSAVYQEVKLAFVPGVDALSFHGLSPREQAEVSQAGFLAFFEWREANPETVQQLAEAGRH